MRQVATLAGVSPATVSRVLNGAAAVRDDHQPARARGRAADRYRPNRIAQNLRRQRAETIGVVVPDIENPHFSEAVSVFEDDGLPAGLPAPSLQHGRDGGASSARTCKSLADERALGVIVAPADSARQRTRARCSSSASRSSLRPLVDDAARRHRPLRQHRRDPQGDRAPDLARPRADRVRRWPPRPRDGRRAARGLHRRDARCRARTPFALDGGFRADVAERETAALLAASRSPDGARRRQQPDDASARCGRSAQRDSRSQTDSRSSRSTIPRGPSSSTRR